MKIGIIGTGHIGKTLVIRLSEAGHQVKVANSRGPQSIEADLLINGAQPATTEEAVADADVVILSIPLMRIPDIAPLIRKLPAKTIVVDTSNYYPLRDDRIESIDEGQVESLWVTEILGRSVVKAWNAIGSHSFAEKSVYTGQSTTSARSFFICMTFFSSHRSPQRPIENVFPRYSNFVNISPSA